MYYTIDKPEGVTAGVAIHAARETAINYLRANLEAALKLVENIEGSFIDALDADDAEEEEHHLRTANIEMESADHLLDGAKMGLGILRGEAQVD